MSKAGGGKKAVKKQVKPEDCEVVEVLEVDDEQENGEENENKEKMEQGGEEGDAEEEEEVEGGGDEAPDGEENQDDGEEEEEDSKDPNDPYAYTKRDEFTSENFKIELRGLPRYFNVGQLKKLLNETLQLKAHKVKPAGPGKNWGYVTFRDQKAKDKAMVVLDEYTWKKSTFSVTSAKPVEDPLVKQKEVQEAKKKEEKEKEPDPDNHLSMAEKVKKSVIPLSHLSYKEQLQTKQKEALQTLRKFGTELAKVNPELVNWVHWQKLRRKGQVCEVEDIIPSPVTDAYRNKCEFTIGINPENDLPTVGFRIASYKEGSIHVGPIAHLCHLPDAMKKVVLEFENFVRNSEHAPFNPATHEGVWRQLNVRTSRNRDILIVPVIHPQDMNEDALNELKKSVVEHFTEGQGKSLGVTSIFFKAIGQKEKDDDEEPDHLWGEEFITETIMDKKFRVSPDAFLQVNTAAAEVLYDTIGSIAELDGTSVLLDICCGTGTIGISLADRCLKVYGVEMVEKAADDARHNADDNGLDNIVIFSGKAEENMQVLLQHCQKVNTVGIVDPPRAGLNGNVVFGLRKCDNMKHLVYVSCDPNNAVKNFISLGRPQSKQYKGEFFIPLRAIPVDLFPHTPHFELVILFERWEERKWRRIMEGNPLPRDEEYFKRLPQRPRAGREVVENRVEPPTGYGEWTAADDDCRESMARYQQPYYQLPRPLSSINYDDYEPPPFDDGYGNRDRDHDRYDRPYGQEIRYGRRPGPSLSPGIGPNRGPSFGNQGFGGQRYSPPYSGPGYGPRSYSPNFGDRNRDRDPCFEEFYTPSFKQPRLLGQRKDDFYPY